MPQSSAYVFLELATLVFFVGFGWQYFKLADFVRRYGRAAAGIAIVWFLVDQIALRFGIWQFPAGGTLPVRVLGLPLEEYLLFFVHTAICVAIMNVIDDESR